MGRNVLPEARREIRMNKYRSRACSKCGHPMRVLSGAWLREQRLDRRLTMAALALRIGCSTGYVNQLEHETRDPNEAMTRRCLAALNGVTA